MINKIDQENLKQLISKTIDEISVRSRTIINKKIHCDRIPHAKNPEENHEDYRVTIDDTLIAIVPTGAWYGGQKELTLQMEQMLNDVYAIGFYHGQKEDN